MQLGAEELRVKLNGMEFCCRRAAGQVERDGVLLKKSCRSSESDQE